MDVDTGSYTIARNYLESGNLPPIGSIRPEEMINYFKQDYPAPVDALGIHIDGAPSVFTEDGTYLLRVGINSSAITAATRKPANIVLVVDTSGSMSTHDRIDLVRHGIESLIDQLKTGDSIGIVTFGSDATVLVLDRFCDFHLLTENFFLYFV